VLESANYIILVVTEDVIILGQLSRQGSARFTGHLVFTLSGEFRQTGEGITDVLRPRALKTAANANVPKSECGGFKSGAAVYYAS
jgi:hypothetical protein